MAALGTGREGTGVLIRSTDHEYHNSNMKIYKRLEW